MIRFLRNTALVLILASCAAARPTSVPHSQSATCTAMTDCATLKRAVACTQGYCVDASGQRIAVGSGNPVTDAGVDARAADANIDATAADGDVLGNTGCRIAADCPDASGVPNGSSIACIPPYQGAPWSGCSQGIAPWCGTCPCPPMPTPPLGNGQTCQSAADCATTAPAGVRVAGVCGADTRMVSATKICEQCASNTDCSGALPFCGNEGSHIGGTSSWRACVECGSDADCPAARPRCVDDPGLGGKCRQCASTADCSEGACSGFVCVAACASAGDCADPLAPCSTHKRCEPIRCTSTTTCPAHSSCDASGMCQRTACATDAECGTGVCVSGACYEKLGGCFTRPASPP